MNPSLYSIRRIRLINFHNFTNETIDLEHGGHLFLLGDNGCGKTTVLDAVHYVLTAGRSLEFNSAARVAGSRQEGRRIQGVVMRYNVETGALHPSGGVTYAALEISGRHGRPTTFAIGISTHSMDESVQRWGIIRECALEDIPFLVHENGQTRPRNHQEMRKEMGEGAGFYRQMSRYEKEVARRLFGGEQLFDEVCRFLSTGKAYREIVSRTSDYHQLFRQLLQEPEMDVFEKVIEHLKTLENSRDDLDGLRRKHHYVQKLHRLRQDVDRIRLDIHVLDWLENHLTLNEKWTETHHCRTRLAERDQELRTLQMQCESLEHEIEELRGLEETLRRKDDKGLVQEVKTTKEDADRLKLKFKRTQEEFADCGAEYKQCEKSLVEARASLQKRIADMYRSLQGLSAKLPFAITGIITGMDEICRSEEPENELDDVPVAGCVQLLEQELRSLTEQRTVLAKDYKAHRQTAETLEKDIEALKQQKEAVPGSAGFDEARIILRDAMIHAIPLYEGLIPRGDVSQKELSSIEQVMGSDVLGLWVVSPDVEAQTRELLYERCPQQRFAVVGHHETVELASWIRRYFDIEHSDPGALLALHREMTSDKAPRVEKIGDWRSLFFRAHQQCVKEEPPRLLGAEARRSEQLRRIKEKEHLLHDILKQIKKVEQGLRQIDDDDARLIRLRHLIVDEWSQAARDARRTRDAISLLAQVAARQDGLREHCVWAEDEYNLKATRLRELELRIRHAGLENLEEQISRHKRARQRREKERDEASQHMGAVNNEVEQTRLRVRQLEEESQRYMQARDACADLVADTIGRAAEDVETFVMTEHDMKVPTTLRAAQELRNQRKIDVGRLAEQIMSVLRESSESPSFAFVYDEPNNTLTDRRGRLIEATLAAVKQDLNEQEGLINEQTTELFRRIVMHELVSALQRRVSHLEHMIREINRLLEKRTFGTSRYQFAAKTVDKFKRLITVVKNYSQFDPERHADELRRFIEDHRDEMVATEVGEIPELLDYRNWFRYELRILPATELSKEGITMDSRTKAVGSGGEQAVPNYLLILTIAHFLYNSEGLRLPVLLFDEAFYGIDSQRRDQLLAFASELGLQLFIASPDQDGVKKDIPYSLSLLVVKDAEYDVHLYPFVWENPKEGIQQDMFNDATKHPPVIAFGDELDAGDE